MLQDNRRSNGRRARNRIGLPPDWPQTFMAIMIPVRAASAAV
jgi:hypothetical protein